MIGRPSLAPELRCTDTISLELDVHLRFRATPVWLSTAIPPSELCAVSPLVARIISSLVPMPEVGVVLPDREHQAQRSKPTAPSRRCARPHPRPSALINSCPGTGSPRTRRALQPEPAPSPSAYYAFLPDRETQRASRE